MSKLGKLVGIVFGGVIGTVATKYICCQQQIKEKSSSDRNKFYLDLVSHWLSNKNAGKSMNKFLRENNLNSIAIYGVGTMGELFYEEVEKSEIMVKCFVDKSAKELTVGADNIPVVNVKEFVSKTIVDAVIITPMSYYDDIVTEIRKAGCTTKIVSLEEMIYNMK